MVREAFSFPNVTQGFLVIFVILVGQLLLGRVTIMWDVLLLHTICLTFDW